MCGSNGWAGAVDQHSVSVIVPTNRGGPYLREAIHSVRAQTVSVGEIILVDDGSPDPGLSSIAHDLGLAYVRQSPSGISIARNTGASVARGKWIAFLDDDDVWAPQRIEEQLRALGPHPTAVASHTGGWFMDGEGQRIGVDWRAPTGTSADLISARVVPPRIPTLLVRRDIYLEVGGCDSKMEPAEDNEFIIRVLQRGESIAVDKPLVGYRRHAGNLTRRGLTGRIATLASIRTLTERAEADQNAAQRRLLTERGRVVRGEFASENLGELIAAVRGREWDYAARVAWWGVTSLPVESVRAVRDRLRRRG